MPSPSFFPPFFFSFCCRLNPIFWEMKWLLVFTLADCEWHAAAPGPLHLPRARPSKSAVFLWASSSTYGIRYLRDRLPFSVLVRCWGRLWRFKLIRDVVRWPGGKSKPAHKSIPYDHPSVQRTQQQLQAEIKFTPGEGGGESVPLQKKIRCFGFSAVLLCWLVQRISHR